MAYVIEIKTDNAAFGHDPSIEVGRILRELADNITQPGADPERKLYDVNGNHVGSAHVED